MYQVDCMTRRLNVNFFRFLKENKHKLNIEKSILILIKKNLRFTSKSNVEYINKQCPKICFYFDEFLESNNFKKLMESVFAKHDDIYSKLFYTNVQNRKKLLNETQFLFSENNENNNLNNSENNENNNKK
jgi:hypothetical protein